MKVSEIQEESIMERKIYLGVENFYPVAVNPTLEELKAMGIPAQEEPVYVQKVKRSYGGEPEQEYTQVSIRVFLDNKNDANRIRTQANLTIVHDFQTSKSGKFTVLNKYGSSTWLPEEAITDPSKMPSNMSWYLAEDIKKALRGEDLVIDFIKALYNLPYVNQKSSEKEKEAAVAIFSDSDLSDMFKGKFAGIRKVISINGAEQKIGFLLGARMVEDKWRQTLFVRMPLKSYVAATGKTDKLVEEVKDAQANGAYADVIFGISNGNTVLREFNPETDAEQPDNNLGGKADEVDDDLPF